MKISACDILLIPGQGIASEDHWLSRWEQKIDTAVRVDQYQWLKPDFIAWQSKIVTDATRRRRPTILVAHGLGVIALVHAAARLSGSPVKGAFLVAPPGETFMVEHEEIDLRFAHVPRDPLPFPSVLVASRNNPECPYLEAEEWAYAWGSAFSDAGDSGTLDTRSGHGPWPEGLMRFAGFLAKIES